MIKTKVSYMSQLVTIVLAGGYATRMWPITRDRSKVLLPVNKEKTVIDDILEEVTTDGNISKTYVSTNKRFESDIREHIDEKGYDNVEVSVENTEKESEKLGVIGSLDELVERENLSDEDLFIVGGDNYMSISYHSLIQDYLDEPEMKIVGYDVGDKESASSYGVLETADNEYLDEFQEKPDNPTSTYISTACYFIPSDDIKFDEYLSGDNNPDEPGWYIQWMNERTDIRVVPFNGDWFDIGTRDSYIEAIKYEMNGSSYTSPDSTVKNTDVGDNVLILDNCEIRNTALRNTVVFGGSKLIDVRAEDYLIDSNLDLTGAILGHGMVGNN